MCDPMTAGILGAVGSIASAGVSYMQQQDLMSKQNQANQQYIAYQRQQAQEAWQKEDAARQRAEAARQSTLQEVAPEKQKEAQQTEQQRVEKEITPQDMLDTQPQLIGDKLLSGQKYASADVKGDIASQITQASRDARARIAALATLQSYGGSQFGLQNRAQDLFNTSGQDIRLQGDIRQGNLAAYGAAKQVPPLTYTASPSPFGSIAGSLAGLAGKAFTAPTFGGGSF